MAVNNHVFLQGLRYRGGGPMFAWILHRLGGLAMIVFVGMHIYAGFLMQQFGSELGTTINIFYESAYFQIVLYFFIIFHAINGLRIIILDMWPKLLQYQPELIWLEWLIVLPIYGLSVFISIQNLISGS